MIFTKKRKEQPLILYEKYKFDHHLYQKENVKNVSVENHKSLIKVVCNLFATCILIVMIFLSAIGVITLMNPQMRSLLENIVGV